VKLNKEANSLLIQLRKSQEEIRRLTDIEKKHEALKAQSLSLSKKIISADEPSFSLSYINWIMSKNNLNIDFDFVLNEKKNLGQYTKFVYTLTGEGTYNDIYNLIWRLTYEPILYNIISITLKKTKGDSNLLKFNIRLEGFTVESEFEIIEDLAQLRSTNHKVVGIQKDIFMPLVKPERVVVTKAPRKIKPKLPPKLPGQIDVEKATLKAVTNNSIFITEGKSGLVELKVGDSVYLGRLVKINQKTNEAEFVISKFGKTQRIVLGIDYRR
jgi:hypothetical protein